MIARQSFVRSRRFGVWNPFAAREYCGLSKFNAPPVFVKLNAIEGWGGGAFTFSIFSPSFFAVVVIGRIVYSESMEYNY